MRVVSLVPSATETLLALGVTPVACTRFCEQPSLPHVGGTKNPDVAAIVALAPDLVVVNDEENRREDAEALEAAGLSVHSMSPRAVDDVGPAVVALAERVGVAVPNGFAPTEWSEMLAAERARVATRRSCVVFVWRRPWMTLAADTYGASLLAVLGLDHVAISSAAPGDAGRYPETTLESVAALDPGLALLRASRTPSRIAIAMRCKLGFPAHASCSWTAKTCSGGAVARQKRWHACAPLSRCNAMPALSG